LDGNLAAPVAVTQPRAATRAGGAGGPGARGNAAGPMRGGAPQAPTGPLTAQNGDARVAEGRIGQAASFDGQGFIQGEDITGFGSFGYYDDKYSISAWIYPTAGTGAIVTRAADVFEPTGHGLNLFEGKVQYNYVSKWLD